MISSFLYAVSSIFTYNNILTSFSSTGISPLEPSNHLNSQFAMIDANTTINSGAEVLNDLDGPLRLFREEQGRDLTDRDLQLFELELRN